MGSEMDRRRFLRRSVAASTGAAFGLGAGRLARAGTRQGASKTLTHEEHSDYLVLRNGYVLLRVEKVKPRISEVRYDSGGRGKYGQNLLMPGSGIHSFACSIGAGNAGPSYDVVGRPKRRYGASIYGGGGPCEADVEMVGAGVLRLKLEEITVQAGQTVMARETWRLELRRGEPSFSLSRQVKTEQPLAYLAVRCYLRSEYRQGQIFPGLPVMELNEGEDYYFHLPRVGPGLFDIKHPRLPDTAVRTEGGERVQFYYLPKRNADFRKPVVLQVQHFRRPGMEPGSRLYEPFSPGATAELSAVDFVFGRGLQEGQGQYLKRFVYPEFSIPDKTMEKAVRSAWYMDVVPNIWNEKGMAVSLKRTGRSYSFTPDIYPPNQALLWGPSFTRGVARRQLEHLAYSQSDAGQVPWAFWLRDDKPRYRNDYLVISANCLLAVKVLDHYLWTGDREFVRRVQPGVRKALAYVSDGSSSHVWMGPNGVLLTDKDDIDWRDWVYYQHEVMLVNVLYYWGLVSAATLDEALGNGEYARNLRQRAERLKKAINERLWREDLGHYVGWVEKDGQEHRKFEIDSHSLAVMLGIAEGRRARSILEFFRRHDSEMGRIPVRWCYPRWTEGEVNSNWWGKGSYGGWGRLTLPYCLMWAHSGDIDWAIRKTADYARAFRPHIWESYTLEGQEIGQYGYDENAAAYLCLVVRVLFGLEPAPKGLWITPHPFADWPGMSVKGLPYRGATLDIEVDNSAGVIDGVADFRVDGRPSPRPFLPATQAEGRHVIKITMGR